MSSEHLTHPERTPEVAAIEFAQSKILERYLELTLSMRRQRVEACRTRLARVEELAIERRVVRDWAA